MLECRSGETSEDSYARLVAVISNPSARFRGCRFIEGYRFRWKRLKLVMILSILVQIIGLVVVALAFFLSFWLLIAFPVFWLIWLWLNRSQTQLNIELAARLTIFDELCERDPHYRQYIESALAEVCDPRSVEG
jgi:hypothetical protein